jgi:hypothetical protein
MFGHRLIPTRESSLLARFLAEGFAECQRTGLVLFSSGFRVKLAAMRPQENNKRATLNYGLARNRCRPGEASAIPVWILKLPSSL